MAIYSRDMPGPGGYAARNLGIEKANGDWIAFLDADDEWYPDHLENMVKVISKHPEVAIIGAGFKAVDDTSETIQPYYTHSKEKGIHIVRFVDFLNIYLKKMRFANTSVIVASKYVLDEIGGFPAGKTNKGGDLYTWIKIFAKYDGAWSPHLGAITYHNAVNKVTSNSYFDIEFLKSVCDEVYISSKGMKLLKMYINSLIVKDYVRYVVNDNRRGFSLYAKVFRINPVKDITYFLLDKMPLVFLSKLFQRKLAHSYKLLENKK